MPDQLLSETEMPGHPGCSRATFHHLILEIGATWDLCLVATLGAGGAAQNPDCVVTVPDLGVRKSVTSEVGVHQLCPGLRWRDPNPGPVTKVIKIFGSGNAARKIGGPGSRTRGNVWWDANPGPVTALAVFGPFQSKGLRPQYNRWFPAPAFRLTFNV